MTTLELSCLVEKHINYQTTQSKEFRMLLVAEQGSSYVPLSCFVYTMDCVYITAITFFFLFCF